TLEITLLHRTLIIILCCHGPREARCLQLASGVVSSRCSGCSVVHGGSGDMGLMVVDEITQNNVSKYRSRPVFQKWGLCVTLCYSFKNNLMTKPIFEIYIDSGRVRIGPSQNI